PYAGDLEEGKGEAEVDREALLRTFRAFLEANGMQADWDSVRRAGNATLVNALSMMSPYGAAEKQALLEAPDLWTRAETRIAITEAGLARGGRFGPSLQCAAGRRRAMGDDSREMDVRMLEILVCPLTKGPLVHDPERRELRSPQAGPAYPVRDGIPVMLPSEARRIDDEASSGSY